MKTQMKPKYPKYLEHKDKAIGGHFKAQANTGMFFIPMDYDRTDILRWAKGIES